MRGFDHGHVQTWRVTNGEEIAAFIMPLPQSPMFNNG